MNKSVNYAMRYEKLSNALQNIPGEQTLQIVIYNISTDSFNAKGTVFFSFNQFLAILQKK